MSSTRRTLFSGGVHIRSTPQSSTLSTIETSRDLVKLSKQARACRLFQASIKDPVCPRIPDRITLRDSSGGWVPQLLVTSLSRRRHSFHCDCDCDCEHIRRVPPASISRHLRLGAPISVRQHPCPLNPHVGPMTCTWVRHLARGLSNPRVGGAAPRRDLTTIKWGELRCTRTRA